MNQLVLFDFDGTLTSCDTLPLFLRFAGGRQLWYKFPILLYYSCLYKCGIFSAQKSKASLFATLFTGKTQHDLEQSGKNFADYLLDNKSRFFRKNSLETLVKYKESSSLVYIVSASPRLWIEPIAKALGVHCIATEFAYDKGVFTGNFLGKNCNGEEKVFRIQQEIRDLSLFSSIIAYGDSKGDAAMLHLAHKAYFKPFRVG